MTRWGVVATIKAPASAVLEFAAYHLDLGADHVFIHLDAPNPQALAALATNPKVTAIETDDAYWQAQPIKRPAKHQSRQSYNATRTYRLATDLDWLAHIDVDEFLCPAEHSVSDLLHALPDDAACARVRPAEALVGLEGAEITHCKAWVRNDERMRALEDTLYPNFGRYLHAGFVSHTLGKAFLRTGQSGIEFRIHRGLIDGREVTPTYILDDIDLCHRHIQSWESWRAEFSYRHQRGSYRAELGVPKRSDAGEMNLHALFQFLLDDGGEDALRLFFEEVCLARPELLDALKDSQLLKSFRLDLHAKRLKHFPDATLQDVDS